jgi:hypothetical protein
VIVETKEQSAVKAVYTHTFIKQTGKILNTRLTARKLIAAVFWDRKLVLMVEFMQQGTTMSEVS